jgi:hypothetical protein
MDHDLTLMIHGALMGVLGSILTSLVTVTFQYWLARRESEILSLTVGGVLVHRSDSPLPDFAFACGLGILFTRHMIRSLRG